MRARRWLLGALAGALVLVALVSLPASGARPRVKKPASGLAATIRWTEHGIPHIQAKSFAGAGYGYGYAFASQNICPIADQYATVDAKRSLYFGPDGSGDVRGNDVPFNNLNSDFFWQQVIDSHVVDKLLAQAPPLGPKPELRDLVRGYVAGYNRYLSDVGGANGVPDPTCRGKAWVHPITEQDAYLRFYQLVLLASSGVAIDGIGEAQPPTPAVPIPTGGTAGTGVDAVKLGHALNAKLGQGAIGSNAVAVGKGGTRDHKHGLLLGNPHFPWLGTERFYQAQIDVPGKMNVEGASLMGVPLVLIGHTSTMAWSHTVSTARRFTLYQLTLVPGTPTTYLFDGKPTAMTSRTVTVQVRQPDGSVKPQSRTLWSSRYGPMMDSIVGIPIPWTPTTAFTMADANATNFRVFNHFVETDSARSAPQELSILDRYQGIPWVNTIAADKQGNALYADIGTVPNVPDSMAARCNTPVGQITTNLGRLPVLDGTTSSCDWLHDSDAIVPGIFGPSHMPHLFRSDYVTNSNDSYWLSNPHQPLTGFAGIIGDEGTARTLRTRIGLIMTQARVDGSDRLGPPGFTRQDMQNMVFSDRQYGGELVRDDLVGMCQSMGGTAPSDSGPPAQIGNACDVLAHWDLHENLDSKGAILFRLFWDKAIAAQPSPWTHPFDVNDPVHTPNGLDTNNPQVRSALGDAINELNDAHLPLDASPRMVQFARRGNSRIPIHGGWADPNGEFNAVYANWIPGQGLGDIFTGSSYVQVVTWDGRARCPDARTILTYSQSTDPTSPFYADQTRMFSKKKWVNERFCQSAVLKGTQATTTLAAGKETRTVRARHTPRHRRRR